MSTPLNDQRKEELFTLIKHRLGAPIRKIELDWEFFTEYFFCWKYFPYTFRFGHKFGSLGKSFESHYNL